MKKVLIGGTDDEMTDRKSRFDDLKMWRPVEKRTSGSEDQRARSRVRSRSRSRARARDLENRRIGRPEDQGARASGQEQEDQSKRTRGQDCFP